MDHIIDLSVRVSHLEALTNHMKHDVSFTRGQASDNIETFKNIYDTLHLYMDNFKELRNKNELLLSQMNTVNNTLNNLLLENDQLKKDIERLKNSNPPKSILKK